MHLAVAALHERCSMHTLVPVLERSAAAAAALPGMIHKGSAPSCGTRKTWRCCT